jgi:hypothetical protein
LETGIINVGDKLIWKLEKENTIDPFAVRVFKENISLGYIKLVHSRVFHKKLKSDLKITIKSIDQNGSINRVFVKISF